MNFHANALCQSMILEGFSSADEARIEHRISHLVEHNGPEFAISTLKKLKEHTIANLDEDTSYCHQDGDVSVAWNHKKNQPKGELSLFYTRFPDPVKRVRVIGAALSSIVLEDISPKQRDKFLSGVLSRSSTPKDMKIYIPDVLLHSLESRLQHYWSAKDRFSAMDMTASVVPVDGDNVDISQWKRQLKDAYVNRTSSPAASDLGRKALANLDDATATQFYNAPRRARDYWNSCCEAAGNVAAKAPSSSKVKMHPTMTRDYTRVIAPGNFPEGPLIGVVGALQQPSGKLRTVVNVNRFVNSSLDPYARSLEDVFYPSPTMAVWDQTEGLNWAQQKLREGRSITSIDLSSATDKLDFRVLTRAFSRDEYPLLKASAEYFEYLAECPLSAPDLGGDIAFKTGQPLGMAGSFQTLSVMNLCAGLEACARTGADPTDSFRVVGDDFVCLSEIAEEYDKIISSWSGETNAEKALSSDRYAEFCSHIVTRDNVYKVKPHYTPGSQHIWGNMGKTTTNRIDRWYRLSKSDKDMIETLASVSDHRLSNLPDIRGAHRLGADDREIISSAMRIWSELAAPGPSGPDLIVSRQTLDLADQENPSEPGERFSSRRVYTRLPDGSEVTLPSAKGPLLHDDGVFNTVSSRYDHKTGGRKDDKSLRQANRDEYENAKVIKALVDDLSEGKPTDLPLPHHEDVKISTTSILSQALSDWELSKARRTAVLADIRQRREDRSHWDQPKRVVQDPSPKEWADAEREISRMTKDTTIAPEYLDIQFPTKEPETQVTLDESDIADCELLLTEEDLAGLYPDRESGMSI